MSSRWAAKANLMDHVHRNFEYRFDDGTKTLALALVAAHDLGIAVLIEFVSPNDSTKRAIRFAAGLGVPKSIALANTLSHEDLIKYAIDRFLNEKRGDRLARTNSPEVIRTESFVVE
jgi:hypothetical protein